MKKPRSFRHLNQFDRDRIEALLRSGHLQKEIADILKVDKGTISREIMKRKRKNSRYEATAAQLKANVKRSSSKYQGMKIEKYPELRAHIIAELASHRSPDEIAGRMKWEKRYPRINTNAIYKWLYSVYGQLWCRYLCTRQYRPRKRKEFPAVRIMIPNKIGIDKRPLGATNKTRYAHFEGDTIVAPKKVLNTESVAIAAERRSNFMVGTKISSLSPVRMQQAVIRMQEQTRMNSLTMDSGIENRSHEKFGVPTFFCDPHSPWQKPQVENGIGLLRRWFIPKGTDFACVSENQLQYYFSVLNHKYRKSLQYKSAYEVALEHGIIKKCFNLRELHLRVEFTSIMALSG